MKDYPAIKLTVLFVIGILLHSFLDVNLLWILFLLVIAFSAFLFLKRFDKGKFILSIVISILIILTGALRFNIEPKPNLLPNSIYKIENFTAFGKIEKIDLIRTYEVRFYLKTDSIRENNSTTKAAITLIGQVRDTNKNLQKLYDDISPGNCISLKGTYKRGREERNPGEFDYNKYLRSRGISGLLTSYEISDLRIINHKKDFAKSLIFNIRKSIDRNIYFLHNHETASLLRGLLLADRSDINYNTRTNFINSGVIHVLAVSGLHTGFIVLFLLIVFGRLNMYLRTILTSIGLLAFMVITGMHASVVRASIMAIVIIISFISNRSTKLLNSTFIAALVILIISPGDIYNSGFQLSFSAVLAIGLIYPILNQRIAKSAFIMSHNLLKHLLQFCILTISAQLGTIPLTLIYFGRLSLISVLANLVVIPVIGIIIALGLTALLFNIFFPYVAFIYAYANELIVHYTLKLINFSGGLSFSHLLIQNFSTYDAIVFYIILAVGLFTIKKFKSNFAIVFALLLCIFTFSIFSSIDNKQIFKPGQLNLMMIDVGQGDSFLVKFPCGKTALIDAGRVSEYYDNGERVIIPLLNYLGIQKIDYGFVSHMDLDHYGGFLSLVHEHKIKRIYKTKVDSQDIVDVKFEKFLRENNVPYSYYSKKEIDLPNSKVYMLNNENNAFYQKASKNNRSGALKIEYGDESILFTGDMEKPEEKWLAKTYGRFLHSNVLKVAHHGSITSSSEKFIKFVKPKFSLISDGIQNRYHQPSQIVVNRLKSIGSKVYRTDKLGAVCIRINHDSVYVFNWRKYF